MQATHFDKTLKTFHYRKPFRPFSVRFLSGEVVDVDHPEAVVVRAGVGVYVAPDGTPTLFDHESVSEVVAASGRGKAQVPSAWCLVPGAWGLVPGAWGLVPGAWCLVPGAWGLGRRRANLRTARMPAFS
jgi:hypothetical protein